MWQADFTHYRAHHRRRRRDPVLARRPRPPRPVGHRPPPRHRPDRGRHLPRRRRPATAPPASTLTDNGMVFTTRLSGGHGGRNGFETELRRLGITQKNSRPNHPTTCGKVERFQQTMKAWLRAQPDQPATIAELQALLDVFVDHLQHPPTPPLPPPARPPPPSPTPPAPKPPPATAPTTPTTASATTASTTAARVTLRTTADLHHIGLGHEPRPNPRHPAHRRPRRPRHRRRHRRTPPPPHPRPHPPLPGTGRPTRPPTPKTTTARTQMQVRAVSDVLRHHMERTTGFEPATLTLARSWIWSAGSALLR